MFPSVAGCFSLKDEMLVLTAHTCLYICVSVCLGFPGGISGKEPACQCRRRKRPGFDPWVGKIPCMATHPVFLPGQSHG